MKFFVYYKNDLASSIKKAFANDHKDADRLMLVLILFQFILVSTVTAVKYQTYLFGLVGGGSVTLISILGYLLLKGTLWNRCIVATAFAVFFTVIVQQQLGLGEAHFHYFISVAILSRYKDLIPLLVHTVLITFHHTFLTYCQAIGLEPFGIDITVFSWGTVTPYIIHMASAVTTVIVAAYIIHGNIAQFFTTQMTLLSVKQSHKKIAANQETLQKTINTIRDSGSAMQSVLNDHNLHVESQAEELSMISSSMEELAASAEHSSDSIQDQFKELDHMHSFGNELNTTFQNVSQSTHNLSRSVELVQSRSTKVTELFNQVRNSLEEIHRSFNKVNDITSMIADIADRTNLLALNASIEAARAGEHGRGFVVVAEEVGKLAETSTRNARDISEIIANSGRIIESGRSVTEEAVAEFQSQVSDFGNLLDTQKSLHQQIENQREMAERFLESTDRLRSLGKNVQQVSGEQKNGTDHVASSIGSLEEAMQTLASRSRDLGPRIKEIQELTRMLEKSMQENSEEEHGAPINQAAH